MIFLLYTETSALIIYIYPTFPTKNTEIKCNNVLRSRMRKPSNGTSFMTWKTSTRLPSKGKQTPKHLALFDHHVSSASTAACPCRRWWTRVPSRLPRKKQKWTRKMSNPVFSGSKALYINSDCGIEHTCLSRPQEMNQDFKDWKNLFSKKRRMNFDCFTVCHHEQEMPSEKYWSKL